MAEVQQLLRELTPHVVAAVTRRYGDFAAAEDAVQEALLIAAQTWPRDGVPEKPRAWLIQVAARRVIDQVRSDAARAKREQVVVSLVPPDEQLALAADEAVVERDDTLELLFMCCHPSLSMASAIALTLRAVGGLGTLELAKAFMVPEATMGQRISRAKQTIKDAGAGFAMPKAEERATRLTAVMHVLYLMFNEGYTASSGARLVRDDLAAEAIRLTRLLLRVVPDDAEIMGLLALMLLTDARRAARTGPHGELIPLDEQDRERWDRDAIREGVTLTERALTQHQPGPYQIQAAIAAVHDEAPSTETTDWKQIAALYGVLRGFEDNPMVELNQAVAIAMVDGPRAGLALIDTIAPRLEGSHRVDAVRGHLEERAGDTAKAVASYQRAAAMTNSNPERDYLLMRAARLRDAQG